MNFAATSIGKSLLAVCADGPPSEAAAATCLLARELRSRLSATDIDYSARHPAWEHATASSSSRGPGWAAFYSHPENQFNGGVFRGAAPGAAEAYAAELKRVEVGAAALLSGSTMDPVLFSESREGRVAHLGFTTNPLVPAAACSLHVLGLAPAGFGYVYDDEDSPWRRLLAVTVNAPGSYRTQLSANASSKATSPNVEVTLALAVDGEHVEEYTLVRSSSDPGKPVTFAVTDTIEIDGPLSVRNGGAHELIVQGLLSIWAAG